MVSLEVLGEIERDRMGQKMRTNSHFGCKPCWKMKSSPFYTVIQMASQWTPGPVPCHGGAPHGNQRGIVRKILSRDMVLYSGGLQSKETETDDTPWDTGIRPHTRTRANKNTLMKLCWGHAGVNRNWQWKNIYWLITFHGEAAVA